MWRNSGPAEPMNVIIFVPFTATRKRAFEHVPYTLLLFQSRREALDEIVFECPLCFHVGFAFPRRLRSEFEYLLVQRTQH